MYIVKDPMETLPEGRKRNQKSVTHIYYKLNIDQDLIIIILFSDYALLTTHYYPF